MKTLIAVILTLSAFIAKAGDASTFESLGFSNDGKYYSYLQEGISDGLGAFYLEMGIIEVASNKYVGRATLGYGEDPNGDITEPTDKPKMLADLKKMLKFNSYGFSAQPLEKVLISRPLTDQSQHTDSIFTLDYWAQGGASSPIQTYALLLNEIQAPVGPNNDWCWDPQQNNMIELRRQKDDIYQSGEGYLADLQIDTQQPKVRACSYNYKIGYVMHSNDSLAVVINFMSPGFEGPDYRYMVVTGKFKK